MAPTLQQLREMSDDELARMHDDAARHTSVGTQWYIDEIRNREVGRQTATLVDLTKSIRTLTVAIAIMTAANVVLVAVTLFN